MSAEPTQRRRIFKYELPAQPRFMLTMPRGAKILSIGRQGPLPYLWASVDETQRPEQRIFRTMTTGEVFNDERLKFVGHVQLGGETPKEAWYEWFVWEVDMGLEQLIPDTIEDRFLPDMEQVRDEITDAVAAERELVAA